MRTDKKALQFAGKILVRCALVGILFFTSAYVFKHAAVSVLLVVFSTPVAVGLVLVGVVILSPGQGQGETDTKKS